MPRPAVLLACALVSLLAPASAMGVTQSLSGGVPARSLAAPPPRTDTADASAVASAHATSTDAPIPVPESAVAPAGRRLSADAVLAIAAKLPKVRAERAKYRGSYGGAYLKPSFHWQVSYFSKNGKKEIAQVQIDDLTGRVLEQWTGFQVPWTMARGYPGAFGRHVNALYVWLPLCFLFLVPFLNYRRPLSLVNLDLLVLLSFSVSLAFFNHARIYASVPLVYPPLLYLLARMLAILRRAPGRTRARASASNGRGVLGRAPGPLRLLVPWPWLALGVVFLLGFRIALNVTDANVIDVGYAGVIGAERVVDGKSLYGHYPADNEHGDTYGPFNYEAYVPAVQIFGWSGKWDDLPAARAAAICFDLLAVALLFLIGRRMRGPTLGVALAYAWVSYPFTLFALESNSNDTLVAAMVLAALLAASYRTRIAPGLRGGLAALAGLTKFAPLALAPLLATHGLRELAPSRRPLALALFLAGFVGAAALALTPALAHDSLHTIYERTFVYQSNRGSPFSVWGLYDLPAVERGVEIAAVVLALVLAAIPRRGDLVGLAAACAAVIIAAQLGIEHWFYLYIPWFFPLVMLALLGRFSDPSRVPAVVASAAARSPQPAAALRT